MSDGRKTLESDVMIKTRSDSQISDTLRDENEYKSSMVLDEDFDMRRAHQKVKQINHTFMNPYGQTSGNRSIETGEGVVKKFSAN